MPLFIADMTPSTATSTKRGRVFSGSSVGVISSVIMDDIVRGGCGCGSPGVAQPTGDAVHGEMERIDQVLVVGVRPPAPQQLDLDDRQRIDIRVSPLDCPLQGRL